MVDGDPGYDIWAMDVARYGDWTTMAYTNAKVRENYSRRFRIRFPNEELPAARPLRTTPVYDLLAAEGRPVRRLRGARTSAVVCRHPARPRKPVTFRRSEAHEAVGAECRAVRDAVGLIEISSYGKFDVSGPEAEACPGAGHGGADAGRSAAWRSPPC